jgi:6-phosphogluconate dehydrogenase (decarboxylating)
MQIGMIGLGRMGANMARRLIRKGPWCSIGQHKRWMS